MAGAIGAFVAAGTGRPVGTRVGAPVVGAAVVVAAATGAAVGVTVGAADGERVGAPVVGAVEGVPVGDFVVVAEAATGAAVGASVGIIVGAAVGRAVLTTAGFGDPGAASFPSHFSSVIFLNAAAKSANHTV